MGASLQAGAVCRGLPFGPLELRTILWCEVHHTHSPGFGPGNQRWCLWRDARDCPVQRTLHRYRMSHLLQPSAKFAPCPSPSHFLLTLAQTPAMLACLTQGTEVWGVCSTDPMRKFGTEFVRIFCGPVRHFFAYSPVHPTMCWLVDPNCLRREYLVLN